MIAKALFVLAFTAVAFSSVMSSSNQPRTGGYSLYSQLTSSQFQDILQFIYKEKPQVSGWIPQRVERQVVSGYNWKVVLVLGQNKVEAVVYSPWNGPKILTSWNVLSQTKTSRPPASTTQAPFRQYFDLTSAEFKRVLQFVYQQKPQVSGWTVQRVTRQLTNGYNWNVFFAAGQKWAEAILFTPLNGSPRLNSWRNGQGCPTRRLFLITAKQGAKNQ